MYKIKRNIKCTEIYDNLMLLDTKRGEYFELNETGRIMWNAILKNSNNDDIVNDIEKEIDAPREVLEDALQKFINSLIQKEFIEEVIKA